MIHLIVYDIPADKTRHNLAALLAGHGQRVQESVFECNVGEKELPGLKEKIQHLVTADDHVRIYPLCAGCYKKASAIGKVPENILEKRYLIV